ncbi:MAG: hypothetical protein WB239_00270 [Acidimicrobiia bacterium]
MSDQRVGADHAVMTDARTHQNDGVGTEVDMITDIDRRSIDGKGEIG